MEAELEISLKDLCYYVLRRWRRLIVWMLVLLVVMDLGGGYRTYRQLTADWENRTAEYEQALSHDSSESEVDYSDVKEPLTIRQIEDVDAAFISYQEYQKRYLAIKKYYDSSVLMQVDTNHVPTFSLRYYVDNHYEVREPVNEKYNNISDILNSYDKKIKSESVYAAVAENSGWEKDASFLNELITVRPGLETGLDAKAASGLLYIDIVAASEEEARKIGAGIDAQLAAITAELRQVFGQFDFVKVGENYAEVVRNDILTQQVNTINTIESYKNASNGLKNAMTAEQQAYFLKRIEKELYSGGQSMIADADKPQNSDAQPAGPKPRYQPIVIKYAVLGLMIGLFMGCAYYAMLYLLSTRLRSVSDFQFGYRIHVLGTYREVKRDSDKHRIGSGVDEWLDRMFRKDSYVLGEAESVKRICAEIEIAVEKSEWKRIHLTGSLASEAVDALLASVQNQLANGGVSVTSGKSVIFDTESLENLTAADAVVLVEQLEGSRYSHIEGELNICKQYHVPVIGAIVVG